MKFSVGRTHCAHSSVGQSDGLRNRRSEVRVLLGGLNSQGRFPLSSGVYGKRAGFFRMCGWRDGRVVEGGRFEIYCRGISLPRVRIPLSPPYIECNKVKLTTWYQRFCHQHHPNLEVCIPCHLVNHLWPQ